VPLPDSAPSPIHPAPPAAVEPRLTSLRRTKIVCTIGPASADEDAIDRLIAAGMNVARLNMSHSSRADAAVTLERIRRLAAARNVPVAVLVDLQGPKIRTGPLVGGGPVILHPGDRFAITIRPIEGTTEGVSTEYTGLPEDVQPGDRVLLSDGAIELEAEAVRNGTVRCRVVEGGELRERQGISLPGGNIRAPSLTPKDEDDLRWAVAHGADYLAISFVRRAEDVVAARRLVEAAGGDTPLIAKLEKPQALSQLEEILAVADGVMVARGDMGVELPPEQVPVWQKRIITAANKHLVPVITATQMLESMIREPRPTRAEATDVANAIWDGTDAVMLSGETSIGAHPVAAVAIMDRIIRSAEQEPTYNLTHAIDRRKSDIAHTISLATYHVIQGMPEVRAIAAFTRNGATAQLVSKDRPAVPILGFCADDRIARRLALYHGVVPIPSAEVRDLDEMLEAAETFGARSGVLRPGDLVAVMGHLPLDLPGSTNFLMLHHIGDAPRRSTE
jgi:pyruvate kinase